MLLDIICSIFQIYKYIKYIYMHAKLYINEIFKCINTFICKYNYRKSQIKNKI